MKRPTLSSATTRALAGASSAMAVGLAIGAVARAAHASPSAIARSAPARLATDVTRWASHLDGASIARAAVVALVLVALAAAARGVVLYLRARPVALPIPRPTLAVRRTRETPAAPVYALADRGVARAEIARRTGLSQDAILLAMYLK